MRRVSIRQPLVIYAVVLALFLSLATLTLSGWALSRAAGRAYRRALRYELTALAPHVRPPILDTTTSEVEIGLVTSASSAAGLNLAGARAHVLNSTSEPGLVILPGSGVPREMYWVVKYPPSIPTSIALVELSRIMPLVLLWALLGAGFITILIYRQLRPSLDALTEIADQPTETSDGLPKLDAPNEIVEIASRFRATTRMLAEARHRAEQQRDALEEMQASLVRASKLAGIGRLAAGVAHELGNPLAAVQGYLRLMEAGLPEHEHRDVLGRSLRELERMHQIIRQLLSYARSGRETSISREIFGLSEAVLDALSLAKGHPELRDLEIINRVPSDELRAVGHPSRLGQVLINLLLNAAHATQGRPVRRICLSRQCEQREVLVLVADSGPGIPAELKDTIFDPFLSTKEPGEGTGLGLAVSRSMMESMGGSLDLKSATEGGSTFALRLGLAESAPES